MKRKYLIVVNPVSGTIEKSRMAEFALKCMTELDIDGSIVETSAGGDAYDFAAEAVKDEYDAVVAIGGDGTVNEVASALCNSSTCLGIIPCGSGNGLARHLALPLDPVEALKVILHGHSMRCDYATANGKPFFCTFGVGFDARVSHEFARCRKRGKIAYLRVIAKEAKSYKPFTYRVTTPNEQFTKQALIIAVANSSQYGNNAFIAPHASMTDGLLDLTVVNPGNPIDLARNSIELFTGLIKTNGRFDTRQASHFTIECGSEMEGHIDGEPVMFPKEIDIKCHPKSLNVFCSGEPEFKPIITPIAGTIQEIQNAITKPFH
ncbi:MAG: diacylglycerol kinase family lipid kinase [Prevotella sp.]|nr:diacylglycerol kinase family lipid kinase [Bacteroides sp.]MCM1365996.1 diacylglycerol kinase family lipid kinase [Prevotella sp.]MCM1437341.1 diacylglycerol kinase family lipid kinase [Prevotella sp.]